LCPLSADKQDVHPPPNHGASSGWLKDKLTMDEHEERLLGFSLGRKAASAPQGNTLAVRDRANLPVSVSPHDKCSHHSPHAANQDGIDARGMALVKISS